MIFFKLFVIFSGFTIDSAFSYMNTEPIRVFQWNALSQALGTGNDGFVKCPPSAMEWRTRRFRILGGFLCSKDCTFKLGFI